MIGYPSPHAPRCSIAQTVLTRNPNSTVLNISDGLHARCLSVVIPHAAQLPMPILFDFHGAGGNAKDFPVRRDAEGITMASLSETYGFALVGGEALQFDPMPSPTYSYDPPEPPVDCVSCFQHAGCHPGPRCLSCCRQQQQTCAVTCGPERVPFRAAVSAVCGAAMNFTRSVDSPAPWVVSVVGDEWAGGWSGGQWLIPEVQTDATGLMCGSMASPEGTYIERAIAALDAYGGGGVFDTSKIFFTGCSMGSAFTIWISQCEHARRPASVSAFASQSTGACPHSRAKLMRHARARGCAHATRPHGRKCPPSQRMLLSARACRVYEGLKKKGDGLVFPPDNYNPAYGWGECPSCEYFPAPIVSTSGLKACVVDQYGDVVDQYDFYQSSIALNMSWHTAGMRTDVAFHKGGHCATQSFLWIIRCLDDGTHRLLRRSQSAVKTGSTEG